MAWYDTVVEGMSPEEMAERNTKDLPVGKNNPGPEGQSHYANQANDYYNTRLPVDQWTKDPAGSMSEAWKTSTRFWNPTKWGQALGGGGGGGGPDAPELTAPPPVNPAAFAPPANTGINTNRSAIPGATFGPATAITPKGPIAANATNAQDISVANPALTSLLEQLAAQARGDAPSIAQMQLQQGRDANIAAVMAQANSQRGGYNPLIARSAMQTGAEMNAKANQEAALARLQEQQGAQKLLGDVGTAMRGQDTTRNIANAQMDTNVSIENAKNNLALAVEQGKITSQEAQTIYNGKLQYDAAIQRINAEAEQKLAGINAEYARLQLLAEQGNQEAAIKMKDLETKIYGIQVQAAQAASDAKSKMLSSGLGALGTVGAGALGSDWFTGLVSGGAAAGGGADVGAMGASGAGSGFGGLMEGIAGGGAAAGGAAEPASGLMAGLMAHGGPVPGQAKRPGDHPENDTIPAMLSPGEFVLPRSLTSDKELMAMVQKKMAEKHASSQAKAASPKEDSFAKLMKAHAEMTKHINALKGGK